jgi:hypothetical protein
MARSLRYHPLFECDVREAAGWYDRRLVGLGDAFVDLVRIATNEVIADPARFSTVTGGVRYARVERFPYLVLFEFDDEELRMLGVLHTARSIEKWREQRIE